MDNEVNETLSHSDVSMEFAEGPDSWDDADTYEVPEPEVEGIEDEGSTSEAQGESEEVVEDAPAESGIESFEDLAESVGEESQESESEDSSEASEDSSEAEGSEARAEDHSAFRRQGSGVPVPHVSGSGSRPRSGDALDG